MRTVLLASLRHHTRRYVASALAVVIGVGFIVATDGLAGALRDGMTADVGRPYAGASHMVQTWEEGEPEKVLELAREHGVTASPVVSALGEARTPRGTTFEASIGTAPLPRQLRWQGVVEGRAPDAAGEVLVDERVAAGSQIAVGDTLRLGSGGEEELRVEVVGIADAATAAGADLYLTWPDLQAYGAWPEWVLWDGSPDLLTRALPEAVVLSTAEHVAGLQQQITREVDVVALLVAVFAAIALGVAILVITNTFAILFAQRARDFALLRCLGVTKRQLRGSVRIEALVLGLVSAVVGVLGGLAVAQAVALLVGMRFDELGTVAFRLPWVLGAALVGVLVTLVAAWFPTRAVTRVSPLAALRPLGTGAPARAGVLRVLLGLGLVGLGAAVLALAVSYEDATRALLLMFAGGGLSFSGVLVLGPVLVPALVRLLGRLVARRGAAGAVTRLATSNAVRNPRRTATTTASLMVGVTLTTAVLAGLGTVTEALAVDVEKEYPLDQVVLSEDGTPLRSRVVEAVAAADGVEQAVGMHGALVELAGAEVLAVGLGQGADALRSDRVPVQAGSAAVPAGVMQGLSDEAVDALVNGSAVLSARVGRTEHSVEVAARLEGAYGPAVLVDDATLQRLAPDAPVVAVWVRARDGVDSGDLQTALALATAGSDVLVTGDHDKRTWIDTQMSVTTGAVLGLLGVAVVIALMGIANTLGLSVLERGRENALLRAMGLTAGQLRRTLAVEGMLLAGVATLLGVAVGLAFGWVGVEVMLADLVESSFRVPVPGLSVVVVGALVSGVLASVLPSRRAARVAPAAGLGAG